MAEIRSRSGLPYVVEDVRLAYAAAGLRILSGAEIDGSDLGMVHESSWRNAPQARKETGASSEREPVADSSRLLDLAHARDSRSVRVVSRTTRRREISRFVGEVRARQCCPNRSSAAAALSARLCHRSAAGTTGASYLLELTPRFHRPTRDHPPPSRPHGELRLNLETTNSAVDCPPKKNDTAPRRHLPRLVCTRLAARPSRVPPPRPDAPCCSSRTADSRLAVDRHTFGWLEQHDVAAVEGSSASVLHPSSFGALVAAPPPSCSDLGATVAGYVREFPYFSLESQSRRLTHLPASRVARSLRGHCRRPSSLRIGTIPRRSKRFGFRRASRVSSPSKTISVLHPTRCPRSPPTSRRCEFIVVPGADHDRLMRTGTFMRLSQLLASKSFPRPWRLWMKRRLSTTGQGPLVDITPSWPHIKCSASLKWYAAPEIRDRSPPCRPTVPPPEQREGALRADPPRRIPVDHIRPVAIVICARSLREFARRPSPGRRTHSVLPWNWNRARPVP